MSIHDKVREKIELDVPGYAQAMIGGQLVSWHRGVFGDETYTGTVPPGSNVTLIRCLFIDLWVDGEARVSRFTFTRDQLLARADQWDAGTGPGIDAGTPDHARAKRMRAFAMAIS